MSNERYNGLFITNSVFDSGTIHPTQVTINGFALANQNDIAVKADIASPAFTGTPTAPTPQVNDNSPQIATTEFIAKQKVYFSVRNNANRTLPAGVQNWQLLTFDKIETDNTKSFANSRFTAPISGVYYVSGMCGVLTSHESHVHLCVFKNGAGFVNTVAHNVGINSGHWSNKSSICCIVPLNKGDFLEFKMHSANGTSFTVFGGVEMMFSGFLL